MVYHKSCCLSLLLSKFNDDESVRNYDDDEEDDDYDIEADAESQRLTAFIRSSAIRSLSGVDVDRSQWIGETQERIGRISNARTNTV